MDFKIFRITILMLLCSWFMHAHTISYEHEVLHHFTLINDKEGIDGSFYMMKQENVYIEDANEKIVKYPLSSFSKQDQAYVLKKQAWVKKINNEQFKKFNLQSKASFSLDFSGWIVGVLFAICALLLIYYTERKKLKYILPMVSVGLLAGIYSFAEKANEMETTATNPLTIDSAFAPFKPNVYTRWDATYFYVESKGIPTTHYMMKGITNWQQQVPIPQCYIGNNAWSVPLHPLMAVTPVPVSPAHFSRGAIAIAVNGVPIFNPYTNTGVDAFLDGQLDDFGGHCGRADDYHYHIAPLSLYGYTTTNLPIAYALDGFAVYGSREPEGGAMTALDANHGHIGANGVYHYHGTATAPYMIANMVGQVNEDATFQIIPQAAASPIRPAQSPLPGAVITNCRPNSTGNGYTLTYTLGGRTDSIVYQWNASGLYTFNLYTPVLTTNNYTGFKPCDLTSSVNTSGNLDNTVFVFPNPTKEVLNIRIPDAILEREIQGISLYNANGEQLHHANQFEPMIDVKGINAGTYFLELKTKNQSIVKKILIH